MKAVYKGLLYTVSGDYGDGLLLTDAKEQEQKVSYGDPELVVDPTDSEVEAAERLALEPSVAKTKPKRGKRKS